MPEVSRFLGIVIAMFFNDHNPPHFHAIYGEHEAAVSIRDGAVLWAACLDARSRTCRNGGRRTSTNWRRIGNALGPGSF